MSFEIIEKFEKEIADFFGSPYAVAVDCCTHGLELCLRYKNTKVINVPKRTYLSVPMLAKKLNIELKWKDEEWIDFYCLNEEDKIIDAAVLWKPKSYIKGTYMCISFQYKKHLSLGRGGVILVNSKESYEELKKMSYDGRIQNDVPWVKQNITSMGYHYYMTPETAKLGLEKLPKAIKDKPKQWIFTDWADLTEMDFFKDKE